MKVISYSLYGSNPKYTINALINCHLAEKSSPEWNLFFYIDTRVPQSIVAALKSFKNVTIIYGDDKREDKVKMMDRFLAADNEGIDVFISRDCDSWLSYREKVCVEEFLNSDKTFHIIRDHCYHSQKIMGGMWGMKHGAFVNMKQSVANFIESPTSTTGRGFDQAFLADFVYPECIKDSLIHIGNQYNVNGQIANYFNDGGLPIPDHAETNFENFPYMEAHKINAFHCICCRKVHSEYIGSMMNNIPEETLKYLGETHGTL
jgi:hypothetical protein